MGRALLAKLTAVSAAILIGILLFIAGASAESSQATRPAYQDSPSNLVIAEVKVSELPHEARKTLELIKRGGPFPYARDGIAFGNRENLLPRRVRGYYREYTVPMPHARNRGPRRIVTGVAGEYYYTNDHYRSFRQIRE